MGNCELSVWFMMSGYGAYVEAVLVASMLMSPSFIIENITFVLYSVVDI